MDRQAWIAISLCVLGLIGWQVYSVSHPPPRPLVTVAPSPTPTVGATEATGATTSPAPGVSPSPAATASSSPAETVPAFTEKTEALANGDLELHLTNRGGAIAEAILLNHTVEKTSRVILNAPDRLPIGAILEQPDGALPEFTVEREGDTAVQFERKTPESVTIRKRFFFPPTNEKKDNYVAQLDVDFRNDGAQPYNNAGYFVTLGSTIPFHRNEVPLYPRYVAYVDGKRKDKNASSFSAQTYPLIGVERQAASSMFREPVNGAEWAALTNQFFTTLLTPLDSKGVGIWGRPLDLQPNDPTTRGIEGALGMPAFQLQPGQSVTQHFQIYLGPKIYERLAKLQPDHHQGEIMDFGWFKLVSQFLLNFMNLIHGWVKDYGVSIILLTACVKGVLWPLQNKANRSMRKMSALAPKMQGLKEKYKDDPTRMNQEVMKLYKEHGVNPVGGCLPMMIQIPIFFGLFGMLREAAELRNATFLWVKDLSQPDTLFIIPGLGWIPFIGSPAGLPINILPILMGATNIWLMRMTPKTGDSTQQKVMMFMPLIFLFFCYNFAAALALYYTTQNLFTILQLYQNRKQPVPVLEKVAPPGKRSRKGRP
jgi:YidC/Oxa1 family membrane protein insertase